MDNCPHAVGQPLKLWLNSSCIIGIDIAAAVTALFQCGSSLREAGRLVSSSVAQLDPPITSKLGNMVLGSPWGTIFLPWAKGQVLQRISTPPCNLAPRLPMLCCWIWISLCHAGTPMVSTQIPSEHSGKAWACGRWDQSQCIKVLQQCETWRL